MVTLFTHPIGTFARRASLSRRGASTSASTDNTIARETAFFGTQPSSVDFVISRRAESRDPLRR